MVVPLFLFTFVLTILSVSAFHPSDPHDLSFAPDVPRVYLHNIKGTNVSHLNFDGENFDDPEALALAFANQFVSSSEYIVKDSYKTQHNAVRHVYLRQTSNDLEILNADMNINVWNKKVMSVGSSFYRGLTPVASMPLLTSLEALHSFGKYLGHHFDESILSLTSTKGIQYKHTITGFPSAISDVKARLAYLQVEMGKNLELVWDFEVDCYDHWWNVHVSATSGEILALFDWVNDASYNAYPIGTNDPNDGNREILQNPAVSNASPLGWHDQGQNRDYTVTIGNNVYAQENLDGGSDWIDNLRPENANLDYDFDINFSQQPRQYLDAATTNLFYWNNIIHDIFWQRGFNEESGNFQENNFGKGGLGNDAVQANSQDGSGTNNANFATPPDGQRPRMRMYIWTRTNPNRDGDLDAGIVIHEYGHGISNRLTGGPSNVNCLRTAESGGMGEGWGDFWATQLRQRGTYERTDLFPMGDYDTNQVNGIRKFPYTTLLSVNPETYGYITRTGYEGVHAKGEVWCGILWETYWNLVDDIGFVDDWYLGEGGNNVVLQNVVDGLKLQPCNPTFVDARNAILQADEINYEGKHLCLFWKGFAKRGLGLNALSGGREDFTVPSNCL